MGSEAKLLIDNVPVAVRQETDYPWQGKVCITINPQRRMMFTIKLRLPNWCKQYSLNVNGKRVNVTPKMQYINLKRVWKVHDRIVFDMVMPITAISADPRVKADEGKRAIQRGPLIYCMEETDNKDYDNVCLTSRTKYCSKFDSHLLGGVISIHAIEKGITYNFIPYYAWDNREQGRMKVWINYK
jgi:DUF1680 family protein